ncbi:MAG: response regulator [Verrucomicrobiota bacterium]
MNSTSKDTQPSLRRVLTIDDVPVFTRLIQLSLESSGAYEVKAVNQSRDAINVARDFKPQLILLDIVMPLVNGNEIASLLSRDPQTKDIPIIFLSGYCPDSAESGKLCVFDGKQFIPKPVFRENLLQIVDEIFANCT